ncbi:MAG: tRNA uridine-5-carboxymethylaminomethyl(34) synthesis GTPase MnmE [Alphaproteobacteria bacterium]
MNDTIFALSTAEGRAGIAVLRVSGPQSADVVRRVTGKAVPEPRLAVHRIFSDPRNGDAIDDGLVLFFKAGASYTGEDSAEFHCHGGFAVVAAMLDMLSAQVDLRLAEPGEFSRRAFENGVLDLTQVEAVADLIDAETEAQRAQARRQMDGNLSIKTECWRKSLVRSLAHIEAEIDFPDEELPDGIGAAVRAPIADLKAEIEGHLADRSGERLRRGLEVAVVGPPNAGKSSFVNRLCGREAAIVTEIAGTTRDVVEVHLDFRGLPLTLADTAGLRETADIVEQEGVRRARARAAAADIVILLLDASIGAEDSGAVYEEIKADLTLINKSDLAGGKLGPQAVLEGLAISVKTGAGWSNAMVAMETIARRKVGSGSAPLITRARHRSAFEGCAESLGAFLDGAETLPPELLAEELRQAARALGRVAGAVDVEDLLDVVFRDFCIGK